MHLRNGCGTGRLCGWYSKAIKDSHDEHLQSQASGFREMAKICAESRDVVGGE
jgi:hypothetical protein